MDNEQVVPETKGVTVKLLETIDLGPEIAGMAGHQFRMRLVTSTWKCFRPASRPYRQAGSCLHIAGNDHRPSKWNRYRLWTGIRLASKIGTPCTGSRTGNDFRRRWRSRSILSEQVVSR